MKLKTLFYIQPISHVIFEILLVYAVWTFLMLVLPHTKYREIIIWLVAIGASIVVLAFTVLREKQSVADAVLVPFESFREAIIQTEKYREMLMNVVLFVPPGLSLPFVFSERVRHKVLWSVLIGMALSMCVEVSQYVFALGRCETDDVIMNTLGMFIGATSYSLNCCLKQLIRKLKTRNVKGKDDRMNKNE